MFHGDCYQILLLDFRSSTELLAGKTHKLFFFCTWGGGGGGVTQQRSRQILATINFSGGEIDGKFLSVWKNFIGNITLGQTSRLNSDKHGIGNDIPDCRSARFA